MFKNARIQCGIVAVFWISLVVEFFVIEFTSVSISTMLVPLIISGIIVLTFITLFLTKYYKNRKNVSNLKEEYLEGLKPKNPLRFCPTDDELLKMYKANKMHELEPQVLTSHHESQKPQAESNSENKLSEDEELTM